MILRLGVAHPLMALAWRLAVVAAAGHALYAALTFSPTRSETAARPPGSANPPAATQTGGAAGSDPTSFAYIAEHPLFFPSRTPWTPPPPPPPPVISTAPSPLTSYALVGVIVSGETRSALIKPPGATQTITLREGQELDGWKLEEITRARLRFGAGDASYEMNFPQPSQSPQ